VIAVTIVYVSGGIPMKDYLVVLGVLAGGGLVAAKDAGVTGK
jgi:hypothetical protein